MAYFKSLSEAARELIGLETLDDTSLATALLSSMVSSLASSTLAKTSEIIFAECGDSGEFGAEAEDAESHEDGEEGVELRELADVGIISFRINNTCRSRFSGPALSPEVCDSEDAVGE